MLYHYNVVRTDIPLGTLCAQLVHAAGESSPGDLPPDTHAVVLGVSSEEELKQLESQLLQADVLHSAIREPDEPWNNQLLAIGVFPQPKHKIYKYFRHLKLLKELSI